jgi:hypothetical protein
MDIPLPSPTKYLLDWFVRYMKNRDIAFRRIANISEEGNKVFIEQKDGKKTYYIVEPFPEDYTKALETVKEDSKGLVVYNSSRNFELLLSGWKKIAEIKSLTIYFVNPFSKTDKRWIITPHTHNLISDSASLKLGLKAMYDMVEPITPEEVAELTK